MKFLEKDKAKAIKETADEKLRRAEEEEKAKYLEGLKNDDNFQKYFLKDIIARIDEIDRPSKTSITSMDFDKIGRMTMVASLVRNELEDILAPFIK